MITIWIIQMRENCLAYDNCGLTREGNQQMLIIFFSYEKISQIEKKLVG